MAAGTVNVSKGVLMPSKRRTSVMAILLVSAACGGGTVDPDEPTLLASMQISRAGDACCGDWTEPTRATVCLAYGDSLRFALNGSPPPYATADAILGCDRAHDVGTTVSTEFGPADPGFAGVVARATDQSVDKVWVMATAVDDARRTTQPSGGAGGLEDLSASNLTAANVQFIRLVIDQLSATHDSAGVNAYHNTLTVTGSWEFWGTPGGE